MNYFIGIGATLHRVLTSILKNNLVARYLLSTSTSFAYLQDKWKHLKSRESLQQAGEKRTAIMPNYVTASAAN